MNLLMMDEAAKENSDNEIEVKNEEPDVATPRSKALAAAMAAEMVQELRSLGKDDGAQEASDGKSRNHGNMYGEFCSHLGSGRVGCKLCGKSYKLSGFRHHMRSDHLPDVTCARCGESFRPRQLYNRVLQRPIFLETT